MTIYHKTGVLLMILAAALPLYAQDKTPINTSVFFEAPLIGRSYTAPPKGNGSPYLYDNWLNGYVVLSAGDTVRNRLFKLDCFKNELIWMSDGRSLIALDHNFIKSFTLYPANVPAERTFVKTSLKLPLLSDTIVRYLEVLSSGKINLYAYRKSVAYGESTIGNSGGLYQVNAYSAEPLYFIQVDNLEVKQVRFAKKSLTTAYPEFFPGLKRILRENHYGRIRNEYQLIQAVKLINEKWKL